MSDINEELIIKKEENENDSEEGEDDEDEDGDEEDDESELPEKEPADVSHYTLEEKIVAAVWVHERVRNHMTWHQMMINFKHRFRNKPPSKQTLLCWERKLFTTGNAHDKTRSGRPIARLMHVPYVKQSIEESPNLSIRERAKELGLPYATLLKILKEDLKMAYVPDEEAPKKKSTLQSPNTSGKWKFVSDDSQNSSKKQKTTHDQNDKIKTNNTTVVTNNLNNIQTSNTSPPTSNSNYNTNIPTSNQTAASYNYAIHPNQMQSSTTSQMVSLYQNYNNY